MRAAFADPDPPATVPNKVFLAKLHVRKAQAVPSKTSKASADATQYGLWCAPPCPRQPRLNYTDTLSLGSECMGGYEASFSHPLYGPAQRRHTVGATGVQEAVACRCLITAETARSVAGQYPAGSGVLPASSTTHTHTHTPTHKHRHKPVISAMARFIIPALIFSCNVTTT